MTEKKLLVKQVKSVIGRDRKIREKLAALGLGRIGKTREVTASPSILGMIKAVEHVVSVQEIK